MGHNIDKFEEDLKEIVAEYVESLKRSDDENQIRAELREKAEEKGLDKKALQDSVARAKSSLKKREGYDEGMALMTKIVDDMGGAENIFSWYIDKQKEKEEARDAARKEREKQKTAKKKAKAEEKAKDDKYKPAPERKPGPAISKPVSGKDAAAGEGVGADNDVGAQQAAAYQKAHG